MDTTAVRIEDAEAIRADLGGFVAFWQMAKRIHHQAAHGVEFIVGEFAVEELVEVLDRRQRESGKSG